MKFQLVLQFPGNSIGDYNEMIALEDGLIAGLSKEVAQVDGHDFGSGEMNIFIYADNPEAIFEKIKPILAERKMLVNMVAAFRPRTGETYSVLWPVGYSKQFKIT